MPDTSSLVASQNPDGGWPYRGGSSCTEPTAYALLALAAASEAASQVTRRASAWLSRNQRPDGGWAPRPGVDQSTWVTSLILLLPDSLQVGKREPALRWLMGSGGRESSLIQRVRSALLDGTAGSAGVGWSWFPDTAAWVTPTSLGLLAAEKAARANPSPALDQRCRHAREYLLAHTCRDHGWNHGSTKALGYDSDSYPETTGQALLALHGVSATRIPGSLECARRHLESVQSLEALSWLELGLLAHGERLPARKEPSGHHAVPEAAVHLLAKAAENGRNIFLE